MAPTKRSTTLHSPVYDHVKWCHSQQGSWQLFVQSQQFLWKTVKERVWQSHSLHLSTRIQRYRAITVPTLLYGAETGVLYQKQIRLLERFHQHCLCSILGIKWQDHVWNEEVLKTASLPGTEYILLQVQLHWPHHKDGRHKHAQSSLLK